MKNEYLKQLKVDGAFETVLPPLTPEEFDYLEQNIIQNGCIDPIVTWNGYVVDGHNRLNICLKHDIACQINILSTEIYKSLDDVFAWMLENQLGRRNLSTIEKYEIIQKYKRSLEMKAKQNLSSGGKGLTTLSKVNTRKEIAKLVGTSEGTYEKIDKIYHSENNDIKKKLKEGKISVNKAYQEINSKPAEKVNSPIDVKLKSVTEDLFAQVRKIENTSDCDDLLDKIEEHTKEINNLKSDIYSARLNKYEHMQEDELICEYEATGDNIFDYKVTFYLTKVNGKTQNRKELFSYAGCLFVYKDNFDKKIEYIESQYSKNEAHLICMQMQKAKEEYIDWKQQQDYKAQQSNEKWAEDFSRVLSGQNSNPEIQLMMADIIKTGFKQLAKVYHPDITHDDGQLMQNLNLARENLYKIIGA